LLVKYTRAHLWRVLEVILITNGMRFFSRQKSATLGFLHMQLNRGELQKVRVKLSKDALTIQKEGGPPYASSNAQQQLTGSGSVSR